MLEVSRFQNDTKITTVDIRALVCSFVVYGRDVAAKIRNNSRYVFELTGFVHKLDHELTVSARHNQTTLDNAR